MDSSRIPQDESACWSVDFDGTNLEVVHEHVGLDWDEIAVPATCAGVFLEERFKFMMRTGANNESRGLVSCIEQIHETLIASKIWLCEAILVNIYQRKTQGKKKSRQLPRNSTNDTSPRRSSSFR